MYEKTKGMRLKRNILKLEFRIWWVRECPGDHGCTRGEGGGRSKKVGQRDRCSVRLAAVSVVLGKLFFFFSFSTR